MKNVFRKLKGLTKKDGFKAALFIVSFSMTIAIIMAVVHLNCLMGIVACASYISSLFTLLNWQE